MYGAYYESNWLQHNDFLHIASSSASSYGSNEHDYVEIIYSDVPNASLEPIARKIGICTHCPV